MDNCTELLERLDAQSRSAIPSVMVVRDAAAAIRDLQAQLEAALGDHAEWLCSQCKCIHTSQQRGLLQLCPDCKSVMTPTSYNLRRISELETRYTACHSELVRANADLAAAREDAERLDWTAHRISGRAWREIGVEYSEIGEIRAAIDAARAQQPAEGKQ